MRICGIKFGHDGAVAVVEDGRLLFSVELEKLGNRIRHCPLEDMETVLGLLGGGGFRHDDIDLFAVDGWHAHSRNVFRWGRRELHFPRAPYVQTPLDGDLLAPLAASQSGFEYLSWPHYAGHAIGAYCSSPFAARGESAFLLSWDGGMVPYLYYLDAQAGRVRNLGSLFPVVGDLYAEVAAGHGPFAANPSPWESLGTPGKIMAYVAWGEPREDLVALFRRLFDAVPPLSDATLASTYPANLEVLGRIRAAPEVAAARGEDVIASYHAFVQTMLLESLQSVVPRVPDHARRLCYAGGCALNIKWNQAIRSSGLFDEMWIPPFPNDAGSALGAACCAMVAREGRRPLDWSVYAGPPFHAEPVPPGWDAAPCTPEELARVLHESGEPVLLLDGAAEVGPRALGNRSILAPATDRAMKDHLNEIKQREDYRPVAPVCLEHAASEVFSPGGADPYMLYDHAVREPWVTRVPAIRHRDGTARLQTVNETGHPLLFRVLSAYHALSGVPLLCNTSANFKGKGFFPDLESAAQWGGASRVWSGGRLFTRSAPSG
jgi:carbamoyltransferase